MFGDIALAIGPNFKTYFDVVIATLNQASATTVDKVSIVATSFPGSLSYPLSRSVGAGWRELWERGWYHSRPQSRLALLTVGD